MRTILAFTLIVLSAVSAFAADFPITDQDQGNIAFLCETAARSPNISIEQVATVAQFCVQWKARVKAAGEAVKPSPEATQK